jgi:hypothetical protein
LANSLAILANPSRGDALGAVRIEAAAAASVGSRPKPSSRDELANCLPLNLRQGIAR